MDRVQVGYWWCFERYEIRSNMICPVAGTALQRYDPWALFDAEHDGVRRSAKGKQMLELPYQDLFNLVKRVKEPYGSDADLIAQWCSRFGLLGVLPHCAQAITLSARWGKSANNSAQELWRHINRIRPNQLVPVITQHFRTPTGWQSLQSPYPPLRDKTSGIGEMVRDKDLPPSTPRPGIIWTDPDAMKPSTHSLDLLRPFFSDWLPPNAEIPMPLSAEFWKGYHEPVEQFWNAAVTLHHAVRTIASLREKDEMELKNGEVRLLEQAIGRLNAFASPVSVSLGLAEDNAKLTQRWAGPSLLSSLAHMALLTLAQGQVGCCPNCGTVFISMAYQAKYCSSRCRDTTLKRDLRLRQRKAAEMQRAGEPIQDIALKLRSTKKTVKGWLQKQLLVKRNRSGHAKK